jgi:hypothetical protein
VYCPWEFTAVIVVFALEMIGAFGSTSPPSNPLTLSFVSSKKYTRNEVNDEEEGMKKMGNKQVGRKALEDVKDTSHFPSSPIPFPPSSSTQPFLSSLHPSKKPSF